MKTGIICTNGSASQGEGSSAGRGGDVVGGVIRMVWAMCESCSAAVVGCYRHSSVQTRRVFNSVGRLVVRNNSTGLY